MQKERLAALGVVWLSGVPQDKMPNASSGLERTAQQSSILADRDSVRQTTEKELKG